MQVFSSFLRREVKLIIRNPNNFLTLLLFFVFSLLLFPFALKTDLNFLKETASGFFWVITLFTILLSVENFYKTDYESGTLSFYILNNISFTLVFYSKICAHILMIFTLHFLVTPCLGSVFQLTFKEIYFLLISLFLGIPSLILLIHFGYCLILGANKGGMMVLVIVLPFLIPLLIFGGGCLSCLRNQESIASPLMLLAALLLFLYALIPWVAALALKEASRF